MINLVVNADLSWLWGSIIGFVATIGGTLIGWFLSKPKNKKLVIDICSIANPIEYRCGVDYYGGDLADGELNYLLFYINLRIYNPSDKVKIINNLKVVFYGENDIKLFETKLDDLSTGRNSGSFTFYDNANALNFTPGFVEICKFRYFVNNNELKLAKSVIKNFLEYYNEKNKLVKIPLPLFDFSTIDLIKSKSK